MVDLFELLVGKEGEKDYQKKPVIVQGITGKFGSFHTQQMLAYGTNIVAGVTPGKGGQKIEGVPIYETMKDAVNSSGAKISIVFVPAKFFLSAAVEALEAGIKLLIAIPEHVPVKDALTIADMAKKKDAIIIGPNTPGIIIPGIMKIGIMPASPFKPGRIAVISRSGTLMYEVSHNLSLANFGQSICLGIGGDPINGTPLIEAFDRIRDGTNIDGVVVVGEIGGDAEEMLAQHIIDTKFDKPVVAYIAGRAAPKEKRMGHAGAIIYGNYGSSESKVSMYTKANVPVAKRPAEIPMLLAGKIGKGRIK
ncbi:MAG: succinate--CoA ligase subunit alpha [Thaumarchaeota archaeon 13_1_40CM_38_12]|nr:MAG: succinate--CoA ligase subunit alpha [Thaumarchaeota archaeon 13_1_40CM_38_12]OLC33022.1 MAG: succinate--CoA ligase subunit alpha [Thaumarchaeota archaeon 13_1_40CM_4_38_7]